MNAIKRNWAVVVIVLVVLGAMIFIFYSGSHG